MCFFSFLCKKDAIQFHLESNGEESVSLVGHMETKLFHFGQKTGCKTTKINSSNGNSRIYISRSKIVSSLNCGTFISALSFLCASLSTQQSSAEPLLCPGDELLFYLRGVTGVLAHIGMRLHKKDSCCNCCNNRFIYEQIELLM